MQAGRIYEEIQAQKAEYPEKQVIAVIDDIGASGGYYIAVVRRQNLCGQSKYGWLYWCHQFWLRIYRAHGKIGY